MATTTLPRLGMDRRTRNPAAPWLHIDWSLLIAVLAIAALGVLMVFSATRGPGGPDNPVDTTFLKRQAMFVGLGIGLMLLFAAVDYRRIRSWAGALYVGSVAALVLVLSPLGSETKGTQAWFDLGPFQFQPSEIGKVALILALGGFLASRYPDLPLKQLLVALVLAVVPIGLILLQPDLGTVLVFVSITMAMLLVGGARPLHLVVIAIVGLVGVAGILNSDVLADYQRDRLTGFVNPQADVQGATYNLDQSQTAIGAGGITGSGLFEGQQTRSGAVPEQQTDFIFTVVGEELGFVGAGLLLLLFALVIWRIWRASQLARDPFGMLVCVGVLALILFQVFQSVGMSTGIMPVTGIPLPFMSYGGSSALAYFAAIGLVLNVHMRRFG